MTSAPLREVLYLRSRGIDFDLACQMDDITRAGYCIIFSEIDGRKFCFDTMNFKDSDA